MFKNYFKTAFRNLWKNKGFALINIAGMGEVKILGNATVSIVGETRNLNALLLRSGLVPVLIPTFALTVPLAIYFNNWLNLFTCGKIASFGTNITTIE